MVPKYFPSLSATDAVMLDRPCTISLMRAGLTSMSRASRFWLIQSGHVALDLHVPGQGRMKIDTIGMGEMLGWSWLFPPAA